jgi:hypothetical protein
VCAAGLLADRNNTSLSAISTQLVVRGDGCIVRACRHNPRRQTQFCQMVLLLKARQCKAVRPRVVQQVCDIILGVHDVTETAEVTSSVTYTARWLCCVGELQTTRAGMHAAVGGVSCCRCRVCVCQGSTVGSHLRAVLLDWPLQSQARLCNLSRRVWRKIMCFSMCVLWGFRWHRCLKPDPACVGLFLPPTYCLAAESVLSVLIRSNAWICLAGCLHSFESYRDVRLLCVACVLVVCCAVLCCHAE